jgi:hypothetical protein
MAAINTKSRSREAMNEKRPVTFGEALGLLLLGLSLAGKITWSWWFLLPFIF